MAKKGSKTNPTKERATALLHALEQRSAGSDYPCTLKDLAKDALPDASGEELLQALNTSPLKTKALAAFENDVDSLIALKTDKERLAGDNRILRDLIQQLCSPQAPHIAVDELKILLAQPVQTAFAKVWKSRINSKQLPDFVDVALIPSGKGKPTPELHDLRFTLPWVQLSQKLVDIAKELNGESPRAFLFSEIAAQAGDVSDELLTQAKACAPYANSIRTIRTWESDEWLALNANVEAVCCSEVFLQTLVQSVCTVENPETKLSTLKKQLPKDLQTDFVNHWLPQIKTGSAKPFFELVKATAKDATLRDARFPRPEILLSEKLVEALRDMKSKKDGPYPCVFADLCAHAGPAAGMLTAPAATQFEPYLSQVVSAFPSSAKSPIALAEDAESLASSALLPPVLISAQITADQQTVTIEKLAKTKGLHEKVQRHVLAAVKSMIANATLPPTVGALRISKKWNVFLLSSVSGTTIHAPPQPRDASSNHASTAPKAAPTASAAPNNFAKDFDAAFEKLDHESGRRNYLKLLDLRNGLSQYSRTEFDAGLADLRRARVFTLESSEGSMVKLTEEEQAAGITDAGKLLTYCRRRS